MSHGNTVYVSQDVDSRLAVIRGRLKSWWIEFWGSLKEDVLKLDFGELVMTEED